MAASKKENELKKEQKKNKTVLILVIVAVIVVAIASIAVIAHQKSGEKKQAEQAAALSAEAESMEQASDLIDPDADIMPADSYHIDLSLYDSEEELWIFFHQEEKTFAMYLGENLAVEGSYTQTGNEVVLKAADDSGNSLTGNRLIIDGEYLLFEDAMCQGTIPAGETFEAEVYQTDSTGTKITYQFRQDGTYTCIEQAAGKTEEEAIHMEGTYSRNGSLIERTLSDNEMLPICIYQDHAFVSWYVEKEYVPSESETADQ